MKKLINLSLIVLFSTLFTQALRAQDFVDESLVYMEGTYTGRVGVYIKIKPGNSEENVWPIVDQKVTLAVGVIAKKGGKNKQAEIAYTDVCKAVVYKSDEKKNVLEVRLLEDFKTAASKKNIKADLTNDTPLRISWKGEY